MKQEFKNFMTGKIIPLSEVSDVAFSHGTMGEGYAVIPEDGMAVAPFDGKVEVVMPNSHAVGLVGKSGVKVLIHLGLQTRNHDKSAFTVYVNPGDTVKTGDRLIFMDLEALTVSGVDTVTPITFTSGEVIDLKKRGHAQAGEEGVLEIL